MFCWLLPEIMVINLDTIMACLVLIPRKLHNTQFSSLYTNTGGYCTKTGIVLQIPPDFFQVHSRITRVYSVILWWQMTRGKVTVYSTRQQQQASPCFNLFQPSSALLTLSTPPAPTPTLVTLCKLKSVEVTVLTGKA